MFFYLYAQTCEQKSVCGAFCAYQAVGKQQKSKEAEGERKRTEKSV